MKCNKCGKKIEETEKFCRECKREIKNISSRTELRELEKLIEEQKKINDLENTKELNNLEIFVKEENINATIEDDKTKKIEIKDEQSKKEVLLEIMDDKEVNDKSYKNLIIILIITCLIIVILIMVFFFIFGKSKEPIKNDDRIDYEKVINEYGISAEEIIDLYKKEKEEIPEWSYVIDNIDYNRYDVKCSIHDIYSDGSIYLSNCKVDGKKVDYTYGKELIENQNKVINIYKQINDNNIVYLTESNNDATLVGSITCKTNSCEYIGAYDKNVLIKEDGKSYLYDYTIDSVVFGPFDFTNEKDLLVVNNTLYGIYYKDNGINKIYNVQNSKVLENIKGSLLIETEKFDSTIMYKYNYIISENNGKYEFINLKTGNISYTIKDKISNLIEDSSKKIVYIITNIDNSNKIKIYNSNGKSLFDGKEYSNFIVGSNNLLVSTDNNFKVYGKDLKIRTNSINYDKILGLYEEFIVATKGSNLILLNIEDNQLAVFENAWNSTDYIFYKELTRKDEKGIYFIIENKKMPLKDKGRYIEYYYLLSTKESGFTEKNSI